jgi:outer membrane protein
MKKYIFSALAIAAMMVSCNNAAPKMDEQPASSDTAASGMKIAIIEVDSLMTQYTFAKDYSVTLERKSNNARNTLTQKGNALQAAVNNFQQKLNNNGFQSREQAASVQNAIQRQQNDLQALQARLENELASETAKFNEALRDSLQNFLLVYNKDKKYDLILSKAGDNILYAETKYDITQDVINGLNKRYKPAAKKADEKKADDKKADDKKADDKKEEAKK